MSMDIFNHVFCRASQSGLVVTCDRLMLVVLCIVDLVVDLEC